MNGWRKVLLAAILTAAEGTAALGQQVATVSALLTVGFFPRTKNPRLEERQP